MHFISKAVAYDPYNMKCRRRDFDYTIACFVVIIGVITLIEYENCLSVDLAIKIYVIIHSLYVLVVDNFYYPCNNL